LHLTRAASQQALRAAQEDISFVVAVSDLDAVWQAVVGGDPPVRLRAPEMKPWGLREFHMYDLDGCLLRFQERSGAGGGRS
jgi:hypothetical protein